MRPHFLPLCQRRPAAPQAQISSPHGLAGPTVLGKVCWVGCTLRISTQHEYRAVPSPTRRLVQVHVCAYHTCTQTPTRTCPFTLVPAAIQPRCQQPKCPYQQTPQSTGHNFPGAVFAGARPACPGYGSGCPVPVNFLLSRPRHPHPPPLQKECCASVMPCPSLPRGGKGYAASPRAAR